MYAHLGEFNVLNITAPYSPEKYIEAIKVCKDEGIEVIIIDSLSHEHDGAGGILDIHSQMLGNSYTNWAKITPRHNAFVQSILQSPCHIIGTIRSKQDYILSERNGKQVPEKVGLKGITRDGLDYEFTIVLDVNIKHFAIASKDRTWLFMDEAEFKITTEIGEKILCWCKEELCHEQKVITEETDEFNSMILGCLTLDELRALHYNNPEKQQPYFDQFSERKAKLQPMNFAATDLLNQNISQNEHYIN